MRARRAERLERFMNPSLRMYGQDFAALEQQIAEKKQVAEALAAQEAAEESRRAALVAAAAAAQEQQAAKKREAAAETLRAQQQQIAEAALRTTADLRDKSGEGAGSHRGAEAWGGDSGEGSA
jgi:peptidoglycan hydrolase CwlO-like protein